MSEAGFSMANTSQHWDQIFSIKCDADLGWYESDTSQTFKFLSEISDLSSAVVFLPGAGTSVLVDDLLSRAAHLVLNDISDEALKKLGERIGIDGKVTWFHGDISQPVPDKIPAVDVWIDRAVLHFLLKEAQIIGYFENLRSKVKRAGYVLLAEFSPAGASKCAGLDVHRYSVEEMSSRLGPDFVLLKQEQYTFISPFGDPRPYTYALFKRNTG